MLLSTLLKICFLENMFLFLANLKCVIKQRRLLCRGFFWLEKTTKFLVQQQKSSCRHCSTEKASLYPALLAQKQSCHFLWEWLVETIMPAQRSWPKFCPCCRRSLLSLHSTPWPLNNKQIAEKEDLLTEMILLSARPTISWVSTALKMVWQRSEAENIDRFAKALTFCSQYCFQKSLQATTGSKLSPSVKRIVQTILRSSTRPLSTGDKISRSLKRVSWLP